MPKQQLPTKRDFEYLRQKLEKLGFKKISQKQFSREFKRKKLKAPRPRKGRETGFVFKSKGLTITVWTTWLEKEERARKSDSAWVLIAEQRGKVLYFSHPIHRTKYFIRNLLQQAYLAKQRVINRPVCPDCGKFMHIKPGQGIKSRYWICQNTFYHKDKKVYTEDWDYGIKNPKILRYLDQKRKQRRKYRDKREKQGRPTQIAVKIRKPWKTQVNF